MYKLPHHIVFLCACLQKWYHSVSITFLSPYQEACLPKGLDSRISLGVWNKKKKIVVFTDLYRDNAVQYCHEIANVWVVRTKIETAVENKKDTE